MKTQTTTVEIGGKDLECLVCKYDQFSIREAQLNTAMASAFGLDWTNPSAKCAICAQCGYIHWFFYR